MSLPILIDESLFDGTFIPERLVSRESQIREIARCLAPIKSNRSARNIFIYGPPGTGKTSVCKWMLKGHFWKNSVYVNCWSKQTTHKIMAEVLLQLGKVVRDRKPASDLIEQFEKLGRKIVICLDESDHIKDPDVLYVPVRSSCSIVLISNQSFSLSSLDPRIGSSLVLHEIEFKPYTAGEILNILKERVAYGIRPYAIDDNLLAILSKMANGDARVAMQTLKIAAKEAEAKDLERITVGEIRYAASCSRKYRLSYLLGKLNHHERTIFDILKRRGSVNSGELFKEYSRIVKEPVIDRAYRNYMKRIKELGLVRSVGSGRWKVYSLA